MLASTRGTPVGASTRTCRLAEPPLGPPTGAVTAIVAAASPAVESATRFGGAVSCVVNSAATSPLTETHSLDSFDECSPPVAFTVPGGTCRTDAPVDAEVLDSEASTEPDTGVEGPS